MQYVADLHLHSKYSRAVSQNMILPVMAQYGKQKGLDILSASDWTHPLWFKEIQRLLAESSEGLYSLKTDTSEKKTLFLLSTEIASIYKQGEKLRRIHNLVFVPNIETAEKVSKALLQKGANLSSDGRPIIGLSSKALLELILSIDERALLIPCHVWTPHFGIYGSASGFDSLDEAFGELSKYIYGVETGLSSDPEMNWQLPELQNRSILSFSDAHSPAKMGREATIFELTEPSFENVRRAIMRPSLRKEAKRDTGDKRDKGDVSKNASVSSVSSCPSVSSRIVYTVEFYPEEGKYHFSGHRNCKISFGPDDIAKKGTTCPVCKRKLTEGVMLRVQTLAGDGYQSRALEKANEYGLKWYTDREKKHPPYVKLVPLLEIIAESMEATVLSQKVKENYTVLCKSLGSELDILLKVPIERIALTAGEKTAEAIRKVRVGNIFIEPGYDGEYGHVQIWHEEKAEEQTEEEQMSLL